MSHRAANDAGPHHEVRAGCPSPTTPPDALWWSAGDTEITQPITPIDLGATQPIPRVAIPPGDPDPAEPDGQESLIAVLRNADIDPAQFILAERAIVTALTHALDAMH